MTEDIGFCIISTAKITCSLSFSVSSPQGSEPSVEPQGTMPFEIDKTEPFSTCWYRFFYVIKQCVTFAMSLLMIMFWFIDFVLSLMSLNIPICIE